jgi:hypothetical protein
MRDRIDSILQLTFVIVLYNDLNKASKLVQAVGYHSYLSNLSLLCNSRMIPRLFRILQDAECGKYSIQCGIGME